MNALQQVKTDNTSFPLLDTYGIQFERAQQFTVDDDVLVQLAYLPDYLPEQTNPIAVCIRKTNANKNTNVTYSNSASMPSGRMAITMSLLLVS